MDTRRKVDHGKEQVLEFDKEHGQEKRRDETTRDSDSGCSQSVRGVLYTRRHDASTARPTLHRDSRMMLESAEDPILHIQMFQPCEKAHKPTGRISKLMLRLSAIIGDFIWMADLVLLALGLGVDSTPGSWAASRLKLLA
jgi:hypothetical protein